MANTAYDEFKMHEGKRYTGMKIGRGHRWKYDAGDWTEKKVTPDKWEFQYSVVKRRKGRAPEGSGAPVGTAYNWYILGRQIVTKLDANSYTTELAGVKYKLAHKRADKTSWSASDRAQRRRLVQILRDTIAELEREEAQSPAHETVAARDDAAAARKEPAGRGETRAPSVRSRRNGRSRPAHAAHRRHRASSRPLKKRKSSTRSRA
ncbi:MAG TPA: hypothetical protein VE620_10800 [Myxococcales bacterium]|jgi:hypothetical protein|nr:hypothetical protein [Myxococcales bacterium]